MTTYPLDFNLFVPLNFHFSKIKITHEIPILKNSKNRQKALLYIPLKNKFKTASHDNSFIATGGDTVGLSKNLDSFLSIEFNPKKFLIKIPGHYYLFYYSEIEKQLIVSSALFNMFPLFFYKCDKYILISSRLQLMIASLPKLNKLSKKFIVEQLIFNYSLFNETALKDVKLCPTNHFIKIKKNRVDFVKHTNITNFFIENPQQWKKSADNLATLFIERTKDYHVKEKSIISFTGGFDGRTLVACANYAKQNFSTFSFGTKKNFDVTVPLANAAKLGLDFKPILLDNKDYIENKFLKTGRELIDLTSCNSNYVYVHFLHSAKIISQQYNYLYAGYFGSELFRALHITGAMNSAALVSFFKEANDDQWINAIKKSSKLEYLKDGIYKNEIEEIIEELLKYKKNNLYSGGNLNHFFYKYVFEEIFRKFFGPLIFSQSNYINVRTPFLDIKFIQELFKSELAGVNNDFFTHNPLKRFKGQYLYAHIISKAYPALGLIKMQKGYRPIDLLTTTGKINIILPYIKKKIKRKVEKPYLDNLSIISGLKSSWCDLRKEIETSNLFYLSKLDKLADSIDTIPEYQRDIVALSASLSLFNNQNTLTK